ncbi:MAG: DUF4357 domain-containing protein [Pirellulales bacterium]
MDIHSLRPRFVVDVDGEPVEALLRIDDYEKLLEYVRKLQMEIEQPINKSANDGLFTYYLPRKGVYARAQWSAIERSMTVLKGSEAANWTANSLPNQYRELRQQLIDMGILIEENRRLQFASDYKFSHASDAASVVAGNSRSGFDTWKDSNDRTLNQLGITG